MIVVWTLGIWTAACLLFYAGYALRSYMERANRDLRCTCEYWQPPSP